MKLEIITTVCLIIALLASLPGCDNASKPTNSQSNNTDPNENPILISEEALLMSLWVGDELRPDSALAIRLQNCLESLREEYRDSIWQVDIQFTHPWGPSLLIVGLTDSAANELRHDNYHAWDSLNNLFGLTSIDTSWIYNMSYTTVLRFEGLLNSKILKSYYDSLPGLEYVNVGVRIGDWPCTYPWIIDNKVRFLVREAWGDCPAGCIQSHFFYFKEIDDRFELVGDWILWAQDEPEWWTEAKVAFMRYQGF